MSQIELILSRHGETEENKLHIMQGQLPAICRNWANSRPKH